MPAFKRLKLRTITSCRVCGSRNLPSVLSLGSTYISDFVTGRVLPGEERYPLELVLCDSEKGCGLLQLAHSVDPSRMYNFYYYHSGTNTQMRTALRDITEKAESMIPLKEGDLVLDIGCNDGTLLRSYGTKGIEKVGFDPAKNLIPEARVGTTRIINDYFNYEAFEEYFPARKAKLITAIAVFYDVDDPNRFVADIVKCLDPNGMWIIQMSYLPSMLERNAFDNICHEHLEYYSMSSLQHLLKRHHLKAVDVELNDVNGGSFRIYVQHEKATPHPAGVGRVKELEIKEKESGLQDRSTYLLFASRINAIRDELCALIRKEKEKGKTILAYGASTKGNTLLQYFSLDHRLITAAAERNPDKFGKKTIGTWIPIISEEEARSLRPDYFLILPWHFRAGFIEREKDFLLSGGRFIIPLPQVEIFPPRTRKGQQTIDHQETAPASDEAPPEPAHYKTN